MDAAIVQNSPPIEAQSLFKKRSSKKSTIRKRPATPPPVDSDSSSYDSNSDSGRRIKRQRKNALINATSEKISKSTSDLSATKFAASRSGQIESTNDATKHSNWFEYPNNASRPISGIDREPPTPSNTDSLQESEPSGTYKGASSYQNFIQKNPNAPSRQVGPIKAPTNIRTITVTDFAPDVCKDYKQTGFCGFGDSCKFLHAREDYKQGWELDKDWEIGTKGKKPSGGTKISSASKTDDDDANSDAEDAKLEGIPFACIVCKKPYTNPIITKCGHYFCEACALQRYRKNPACAACGAGTGGVFNGAKGLKKLLERKKERARRRREKAIEEGEEVSDESEEEE